MTDEPTEPTEPPSPWGRPAGPDPAPTGGEAAEVGAVSAPEPVAWTQPLPPTDAATPTTWAAPPVGPTPPPWSTLPMGPTSSPWSVPMGGPAGDPPAGAAPVARRSRALVVGLIAAAAVVVLVVGAVVGIAVSRSSGPSAPSAGPPSATAPGTPGPTGSRSATAPPPAAVAPGPVSTQQAVAALADYDRRNAVAIRAETLASWKGVDGGPILETDQWSTSGDIAASKAGHPSNHTAVPTTTLVRLLGSGTTSSGETWFTALVTFGDTTSDTTTNLAVYERAGSSSSYVLTFMATATDPTLRPASGGEPAPSATALATTVRTLLSTHRAQPGLSTGRVVDAQLWSLNSWEASVSYRCAPSGDVITPVSAATTGGALTVLTVHCTRTTVAKAGTALTWNTVDQWLYGGATPALSSVSCPVAVMVATTTTNGASRVDALSYQQTARCTGTKIAGSTPSPSSTGPAPIGLRSR